MQCASEHNVFGNFTKAALTRDWSSLQLLLSERCDGALQRFLVL
jgi:hypothetical protein